MPCSAAVHGRHLTNIFDPVGQQIGLVHFRRAGNLIGAFQRAEARQTALVLAVDFKVCVGHKRDGNVLRIRPKALPLTTSIMRPATSMPTE